MDKIDYLISDVLNDLDHGVALSLVINRAIRIANQINNLEMLIAFKLENRSEDTKLKDISNEFHSRALEHYGDKKIAIDKLYELTTKYNDRRQFRELNADGSESNLIKSLNYSISEIENQINLKERALERNTVSEGMTPLDNYFAHQKKENKDQTYLYHISVLNKVLSNIRHFVYFSISEVEVMRNEKACEQKAEITNSDISFSNQEKENIKDSYYTINNIYNGDVSNPQTQQGTQDSSQSMTNNQLNLELDKLIHVVDSFKNELSLSKEHYKSLEESVEFIREEKNKEEPNRTKISQAVNVIRQIAIGAGAGVSSNLILDVLSNLPI